MSAPSSGARSLWKEAYLPLEDASEGIGIGELSTRTGCAIETIRYYERAGVISAPSRTGGGRRVYTATHERQLAFILRARSLGFSLDRAKRLLDLAASPTASPKQAWEIATAHLEETQRRIAELQQIVELLTSLLKEDPESGGAKIIAHLRGMA